MSGLHRNDPKTHKGKYPVLLRRDGTVPEWEWFVLGARDVAAVAALRAYADAAEHLGYDPVYVRDLYAMAESWVEQQRDETIRRQEGLDLSKPADPDGPLHRVDDPDVLTFPASLAHFKSAADRAGRRRLCEKALDFLDPETAAAYHKAEDALEHQDPLQLEILRETVRRVEAERNAARAMVQGAFFLGRLDDVTAAALKEAAWSGLKDMDRASFSAGAEAMQDAAAEVARAWAGNHGHPDSPSRDIEVLDVGLLYAEACEGLPGFVPEKAPS
jgi:hypothetical protein